MRARPCILLAAALLAAPWAMAEAPTTAPVPTAAAAPGVPEMAPASVTSMPAIAVSAPVASPAVGGVSVAPKLVRQGYFAMPDCASTGGTAFNECLCKADIYKAEVQGTPPSATAAINKQLAQVPEQLGQESCQGNPTPKPVADTNMNESTAAFSVPYQTPNVLTVLVTYMTYGAGSAHPMSGTEGYSFDAGTGKPIDPVAKLTAPQLEKLNATAQAELMKKYGDVLFDEAKTRTDPYVAEGSCDSCTLYYTKDGWNLRFQLYAVAPYSAGEPTITIPADILPAPEGTK